MGNSRWRLETTINLTLINAQKAGFLDEIEIVITDWGSEEPLSEALSLIKIASERVKFLHIPPAVAEAERKDSPFPEVIALNAAARRASGQFIGRIDNDTVIGTEFFNNFFKLYDNPRESPVDLLNSYLFVERRSVPYRLTCKSFPYQFIAYYLNKFGDQLKIETAREFDKPFWQSPVGIMLMSKDLWHKARGYDERLLYWGWMESDFVIRVQDKNPIVDFKNYVGNHFYHLEHYNHLTDYRNRNGLATPRKKNETISCGDKYAVNGENWGLCNYNLTTKYYNYSLTENKNNNTSSIDFTKFRIFLIQLYFMLKYDALLLEFPDLKNRFRSKIVILIGKIKNKFMNTVFSKFKFLMQCIKKLLLAPYQIKEIESHIATLSKNQNTILELLGNLNGRYISTNYDPNSYDFDYKIYSQAGDDGIIQYLVNKICIPQNQKTFIEFGVQNYLESNTRFLLINNNWSGLVMDGSKEAIDFINNDEISRAYGLKARQCFITRENINNVFREENFIGEIGILSIDIDGNDYWIWEEINAVDPLIVIIEYNHRFGSTKKCTIPYDADFVRSNAHYSNIYYGASLNALVSLGAKKGYKLFCCNNYGNNAYFIKDCEMTKNLPSQSSESAYKKGLFRESRDSSGKLAFMSEVEEKEILDTLPIMEIN
jgi:hypothetical protein